MPKEQIEKPLRWVAYYRVSTQRQGQSGLGLDAQKASVEQHIARHGGELIESFTEVESGRKMRNRPELQRALDLAKRKRATLIIAKLDRLARNLHTVTSLMESRIEFVAVDNPNANRLTIQILAAVAEDESRRASIRTSEALRQAKARGIKIGETGKILAKKHKKEAMKKAESYLGVVRTIRALGLSKVRDIRDELNRRNIPSPGGGSWHLPNTHRLLTRLALIELGSSAR
jgi:DNA invertase Pin-like site-specific DNA recombinase